MPNIYIDGKKIEATDGETVINAAFRNGINIPHFCWHPELSISGNCRMCLVEIGSPKRNKDGSNVIDADGNLEISYMPKLQIACNTIVSEGLHIRTNTAKVKKAREAVMEFILINHPLDCPICDEAGQCKLQEYSQIYSNGVSRFEEAKNINSKRVEWNEKIMYDAERCISCGRCIRFTHEIADEDILTFINRGDKVRIERFDDAKLQNSYSMNVIDICPVGALTSRDFRFKARVWEMSFNDTICTGCSRGCNIRAGVKNNKILRLEPRQNVYVNKNWMCDEGRLQYSFINDNRINTVRIRKNGTLVESNFEEAISLIQTSLKNISTSQIYFLASSIASTETNYLLKLFANNNLKNNNIVYLDRIDNTFADNFLKQSYRSPNTDGLKALNINNIKIEELISKINSNSIKALYILDEDFTFCEELIPVLERLDFLVIHSYNENKALKYANVVFPILTFAEQEGTFINCNNRVQYFSPVIKTNNILLSSNAKLNQSRLDKFGAYNDKWHNKENVNAFASWSILSKLCGKNIRTSEDIFKEICNNYNLFKGLNYDLLVKHRGVVLGNSNPDSEPLQVIYQQNELRP